MADKKVYGVEEVPDDAELYTKGKEFDPIDASNIYQVMIDGIDLQDNIFYKPDETDLKEKGDKYSFSFRYIILDKGEFYGRRLWDQTGLAFKADGKRGPTKLYKIIMAALQKSMTPEDIQEYAPDLKTFYKNIKNEVAGLQVKVGIENTEKDGKIRSKVVAYHKIKTELAAYDPDEQKKFEREIAAAPQDANPGDEEQPAKSDLPF